MTKDAAPVETEKEEQDVPSWVVGKIALAIAKANRHGDPEAFAEAVVRAHEGEEPHPEPEAPVDLIGEGEAQDPAAG